MRFRDPVCGMEIRWEEAVDYEVVGPVVVYFCCTGCATRFREDPAQHVDVHAWVEGGGRAEMEHCDGEPLALQPPESPARRSRTLATAPRVGMLTLDEVEALVALHWRRLLGDDRGQLRARTLERALLTFALTDDADGRKDIDRLLAAEVARLRTREIDTERIEAELALLPRAFAAVLLGSTVEPAETEEFYEVVEMKLAEIRPWVSARHAGPLESSPTRPGTRMRRLSFGSDEGDFIPDSRPVQDPPTSLETGTSPYPIGRGRRNRWNT